MLEQLCCGDSDDPSCGVNESLPMRLIVKMQRARADIGGGVEHHRSSDARTTDLEEVVQPALRKDRGCETSRTVGLLH